mmetsp:Transcript_2525/g.7507  ORF Transcript_2525/g.7507 Transcript_2525/m.7507 type:complete len:352 (-) Transcript_2525:672-1727(-)|eukprot:CAMPEP_0198656932 /NCGR_PEP_ID=MMETSP1467-20131203/11212_1 /TAXON_ID=1462469 /ORGANISM="unid. sp., Strain CCMP2135" /LENGTH=351 /DNA_ID=CAMNT_0044393015 /DNA_START=102 /DNA_END=1157 /DNA_ORIENTATION=-
MKQAIPTATVVVDPPMPPPPPQNSRQQLLTAVKRAVDVPPGIAEQLVVSAETFATRYYIVDNSGSMSQGDGHRLLSSGGVSKLVSSSRWDELGDTLTWVAKVAIELNAPTEFRLLNPPDNGPQVVRVGDGTSKSEQMRQVTTMVASAPTGRTPLCAAIGAVVAELSASEKVCVVIASDGEATDGDVAHSLRPLRDFPAWCVVRLCTDSDAVVSYWNAVDDELELDLDVLDDLAGEAQEVTAHSRFLTYGLALHRLREFGTSVKLIDVLDERSLHKHELLELAVLLFGADAKEHLPHPDVDFSGFSKALGAYQRNFAQVFDPLRNARRPWFDVARLSAVHQPACGAGSCTIS